MLATQSEFSIFGLSVNRDYLVLRAILKVLQAFMTALINIFSKMHLHTSNYQVWAFR